MITQLLLLVLIRRGSPYELYIMLDNLASRSMYLDEEIALNEVTVEIV